MWPFCFLILVHLMLPVVLPVRALVRGQAHPSSVPAFPCWPSGHACRGPSNTGFAHLHGGIWLQSTKNMEVDKTHI
jgi:hypothetical protein